jgi:hydroxymethylpyrimidine pyrophosphatase-like HAD family hydrolase
MAMLIVLDYDETYTEDKILWDQFIKNTKSRGHTVICCTNRFNRPSADNDDVIEDMGKHGVEIVFSGPYRDKFDALLDADYNPQNAIWIDDRPSFIASPFRPLDEVENV